MSFHFFLSATKSLHLLTPSTWRSLSSSSLHLFLCLPLLLVPSSSWVKIFLGILSSSILSRWPKQLILCPFIHFTIFSPSVHNLLYCYLPIYCWVSKLCVTFCNLLISTVRGLLSPTYLPIWWTTLCPHPWLPTHPYIYTISCPFLQPPLDAIYAVTAHWRYVTCVGMHITVST